MRKNGPPAQCLGSARGPAWPFLDRARKCFAIAGTPTESWITCLARFSVWCSKAFPLGGPSGHCDALGPSRLIKNRPTDQSAISRTAQTHENALKVRLAGFDAAPAAGTTWDYAQRGGLRALLPSLRDPFGTREVVLPTQKLASHARFLARPASFGCFPGTTFFFAGPDRPRRVCHAARLSHFLPGGIIYELQ